MKVKIPSVQVVDGDYISSTTPISFSEVGPGKFRGIVPVIFNSTTNNLKSAFPVTLEADSSDAQKGKRRVMIKVSIPYRRGILNPIGGQPQMGSDAGEIACHMVVSVPKALVQDLTVPDENNKDASVVASSTLYLAIQLLKGLSLMTATGQPQAVPEGWTPSASNFLRKPGILSPGDEVEFDDEMKTAVPTTAVCDELMFVRDAVSGSVAISVPVGLVTKDATKVGLDNALFDPVVRGLLGSRPLEEDSEVLMPATYGLGTDE